MTKVGLDLADHRTRILHNFEQGRRTIVIERHKFKMKVQRVSNVDYIIVSPVEGFVPCANFIRSELEYSKEMNRRARPAEDRGKRQR